MKFEYNYVPQGASLTYSHVRPPEEERGWGAVVKKHRFKRWLETKPSWTVKSAKKGKSTLERSIDVKRTQIFSILLNSMGSNNYSILSYTHLQKNTTL